MPKGSAPIDASYALSAWIDTKFWHHICRSGEEVNAPAIGTAGNILHCRRFESYDLLHLREQMWEDKWICG